jgi:hypothetical protein
VGTFKIDDELLKRQKKRQRLRKLKKEQRKIRKNKLIKLGTLFLVTELLEESQDTMLGFLKDFQPKDEYLEEGEKFLKNRESISYPEYYDDKRKLFYKMIRKSALLEKLNIHNDNPNTILGYLLKYKGLEKEQLEKYNLAGKNLFKVNPGKRASDEEKIELLRLCIKKGIDLNKLLREKYNGVSIHDITFEMVNRLKNIS